MRVRPVAAFLGLILAAGLSPSGAVAADRIAVVDAARVLKEYHKTKRADEKMTEQVAEFNAEKDKMLSEHARLKKEFEKARAEAQDKALSEKALNEKRDTAEDKLLSVVEYERKIQDTTVSHGRQLDEQRFRMHQRLADEITEAVQKQAVKDGYTLVLDSSGLNTSGFKGVLYSVTNVDLTATMIEILNKAPSGAGE